MNNLVAADIWNDAAYKALKNTKFDNMSLGELADYEPDEDIFDMENEDDIIAHAEKTVAAFLELNDSEA